MTRSTLDVDKLIAADVGAIKEKLAGGIASARQITTTVETGRALSNTTFGTMSSSRAGTTESVRVEAEKTLSSIIKLGQDLLTNPNKTTKESITELLTKFGNQFDNIKDKLTGTTIKALQNVADQNAQGNEIQKKYSEMLNSFIQKKEISFGGKDLASILQSINKGELPRQGGVQNNVDYSKLSLENLNLIYGKKTVNDALNRTNSGNIPEGARSVTQSVTNAIQKAEVAFGELKISILLPDNLKQLSSEDIKKMLSRTFDSPEFKNNIMQLVTPQNPTKAPVK